MTEQQGEQSHLAYHIYYSLATLPAAMHAVSNVHKLFPTKKPSQEKYKRNMTPSIEENPEPKNCPYVPLCQSRNVQDHRLVVPANPILPKRL